MRGWMALAVVSVLAVGCVAETPDLIDDGEDTELALEGAADAAGSSASYFLGRQDTRRCRFPLCGGVWVSRPNRRVMTCPDGSRAAECYVALVDVNAVAPEVNREFAAGRAVIEGDFGTGNAGEFGSYATLIAERAWIAATDARIQGPFYLVEDNGIRCVRAPCFSTDERRLNSTVRRTISDLDLSDTGASDEQIGAAFEALAGEGVIATGYNWRSRRTGAVTLEATTLWLPAVASIDPTLACSTDADCTVTEFHSPVASADECYCTSCPTTVANVSTAEANAASHRAICGYPVEGCPVVRCARPAPAACVAGVCQRVDTL